MAVFLLLPALLVPRITIVLLWLLSSWFAGVFNSVIIPLLGFIFLPYTLLWYSAVVRLFNGTWGFWQLVILGVAILLDVVPIASGERSRRRR